MIRIHVMSVKLDILRIIKWGLRINVFYNLIRGGVVYYTFQYNFIETFLITHMSNTQINFCPVVFSSDVQYIVVYNRTTSQNIDSSINDIFMKTKTCQIKVCEKFVRMDRLWKKIINVIIDSHHPLYRNYLHKMKNPKPY